MELFNCLTDFEKVELLARHQKAFDSHTTVRDHVIPVLTEFEQTCIREGHSSTEYTALLRLTVMEAFTPGSTLSNCISEESYLPIFMAITESQAGGLSEESQGLSHRLWRKPPAIRGPRGGGGVRGVIAD